MLTVSKLFKRFDRKAPRALDGVSFEVREKEVFGLLGHNGAGKSTALGIILGMVYPDSGDVNIGGVSVRAERESALGKVGAIFESPNFYEYLSGWRNLRTLTAFSGGVSKAEILEIVEWVGLSKRIHDRVGTYSHGMRQRLALAQALLPRPEILILDEPTDGLDPEGIVEFRRRIHELRDNYGVTILLSSHLLSEVEQTCDRVAILQSGRKVYEGNCRGLGDERNWFRIDGDNRGAVLETLEDFRGIESPDGLIGLPADCDPADFLESIVGKSGRVREFAKVEETLEDLYLKVSQANSVISKEGGPDHA